MQLMRDIRESIKQDRFPEFVQGFMKTMFPDNSYPDWAVKALASINIVLDSHHTNASKQVKPINVETKHENVTHVECNY